MDKDIILQVVAKTIDIGSSKKHYVSIDVSAFDKAFPVTVYIHNCKDGYSNGICDTVYLSMNESYELHKEWFDKWSAIIAKEREADDSP